VSSLITDDVQRAGASARSQRRHSRWPFWALLAANSPSVPTTLVGLYLSSSYEYYVIADTYLLPIVFAIMFGQLFLLAFWMAFGSWPSRWRSLFIFAITSGGGLAFGIAVAIIEYVQGWDDGFSIAIDDLILMAVAIPIFASALVWITNAIFSVPAWYFSSEISRRISAMNARPQSRIFGVSQLFIWMGQVAIPLGLLQAFCVLTDDQDNLLTLVAPYLLVMTCATPLAVGLLKPRFSIVVFGATCIWSLATAVTFELVTGDDWRETLPGWSFLFLCATIAANLLALRRMGLCWQPRVEELGQPNG
jgi:hypothetical protein